MLLKYSPANVALALHSFRNVGGIGPVYQSKILRFSAEFGLDGTLAAARGARRVRDTHP